MADWDEDSPELRQNLETVLDAVAAAARGRVSPSVQDARDWQTATMNGLDVPDPLYVGRFRGEPGLENVEVHVGTNPGTPAGDVAYELRDFEMRLRAAVATLDGLYPDFDSLDEDGLKSVIDVCAWAHAEWVRIHPFANGNGRTARLWANSIAMRYGLPPFVRLRPRPGGGYGAASAAAMRGNHAPTARVFREMFESFVAGI